MASVLILGASSDIAQAIAYKFAQSKYDIFLAGRNSKNFERIASDLEIRHNIKAKCFDFDAEDMEAHQQFMGLLPNLPLITICVFGYLGDQTKAQSDWKEAKRIIDVNFTGAVSILSIIANKYQEVKSGTIIGISSVAGDRGRQSNYFYGAAKAGFSTFLDGLRNRMFQHQVHVMTVKPGFVNTRMTKGLPLPAPLTAQPEQVATAVYKAFLKKSNTLYVLWMWKWIMMIIKNIPEFIFKKLKL
jgi:hypothetical protein